MFVVHKMGEIPLDKKVAINIVQHGTFCCMLCCLEFLMNYLPFTAANALTDMQVTKSAVFQLFPCPKTMVPSMPVSPCCCGKRSDMFLSHC